MTEESISKNTIKIQLGTAITVILFAIYSTLNIQTRLNNTDNAVNELRIRDNHFEEEIHKNIDQIQVLQDKTNLQAVNFAEINATLINIEKTLASLREGFAKYFLSKETP